MSEINTQSEKQSIDENRIPIQIGGTTFLVGLHFSTTSKETLEDKIRSLIGKEVKERLSMSL
ncbi:MAG: transposon-encoded TnpW family protein [Lachnospiraceae bacterium]|nr:transposon-encoded TnpW family protein [Lachnospiraceae bacterium]